jgi:hypothetical protein
MAQGNYDNPSYLTRQQINLGATTAGANATSGGFSFISDMRIRKASYTVRTAGTSSGAGNGVILLCVGTCITGFTTGVGFTLTTNTGTTTICAITALGSSTAQSVSVSTDCNTRIVAGSALYFKNGTDATGVAQVTVEAYIDPEGSWT